ncbi:MAG TPA: cupin domain-containing protein [Pyrinomonadaceae bacterium]|nr:cupin domain-containing protein [Pyrinomonadaceae bacterium]
MKIKRVKDGLVSAIGTTVLIMAATSYSAFGQPTVTPLAPVTQFDEINENLVNDGWHAKIKTKGISDFHVVEVTIPPGGSLPWHIHLGPSFFIVKSGTATLYHGDDPTCTPAVVPAGSSLFEPGNDLHIVRNEGTVPLVNVVVQLIPTGAPRLIPRPAPGNCPF